MEYLPVAMVRGVLETLPQHPLPAPFTVRAYRPGDAAHWLRIHRAADRYGQFPPEKFAQQFGRDEAALEARQLYLCDGDARPIGTATAWFDENYRGQPSGRIHWVAIVPEWQGRGLAKPLLARACRRLRELGHRRAYLTSATVRIPALNLYLAFGFLPDIRDEADVRAWRLVGPHLKPHLWQRVLRCVPTLA